MSKTLAIKFDALDTAFRFMDDISDLIYWNDQEKEPDQRRYEDPDETDQISFSWDGVGFRSCRDANSQIRQEKYGTGLGGAY